MPDQPRSIWSQFLRSPHHAVLAAGTLGAGFATGEPLYLIIGGAAYVLGWVYGPDLPVFRRWLAQRSQTEEQAAAELELSQFASRRAALIEGLTPARRSRYAALADVCRDIADSDRDRDPEATNPRERKLEELMWTYLRLLTIEESLEEFLEAEARDDVPGLLVEAEQEVTQLTTSLEAERASGRNVETRERLLESRRERLETIRKRHERIDQARSNLALVVAEQERLDEQVKLIRADSIATRNTAALSARIDATVEHLEHTHRWLAEMDQFKDLLTDLPPSDLRIGFGDRGASASGPPPLPAQQRQRGRERS